MSYFTSITAADRVLFEDNEVIKITHLLDRDRKVVTHYQLWVRDSEQDIVLRTFEVEEVRHLLEVGLLTVDRGYNSLARQTDRALYGTDELFGAGKKQRARVDRITYLCSRMAFYCKTGMPLTIDGVQTRRAELEDCFKDYQAKLKYGTEKHNSTQNLKSLPSNYMLLEYYRKFRRSQSNASIFVPPQSKSIDLDNQQAIDLHFVLTILNEYASATKIAKCDVAEKAVKEVEKENDRRRSHGFFSLIEERSARTYERWIDKYLDPFTVIVQREGLAAAKEKFGSVEGGMNVNYIGEQIILDAWKVHVVSLNATRDQLNRMSPNERAKVKKVRRWVVVAMDMATRMILGFAFCKAPNQEASLKALRLCFTDKTHILEQAGLRSQSWHHRTPIHLVSTDSGSEFGKHPFGGALFGAAVRRLTGSFLNSVTGVPELRGTIERLFLTFELKWARHLPGWTAGSVSQLNDRKPYFEACLTDDELERLFVQFIADYNNSPHRGLENGTPTGAWEKLSQNPLFDLSMLPGPTALREACGKYTSAEVSKTGIRFSGLDYSNEFIRGQRMAKGVDRLAKHGEKIEIKFDPLNLGAISVMTGGDLISVRCLDDTMLGKSIDWWVGEQRLRRAKADHDVNEKAAAREEARNAWKGESAAIARSAGVDPNGRTHKEIERHALEIHFGKGQHEKPFIGRDEHIDPIASGIEIGVDFENEELDSQQGGGTDESNSRSNPLDKFRSKRRPVSKAKPKKGQA